MAGHSKWSKIKRQKGATDAQRAKLFTKIGREIAVAVKGGGSDPASNSKLRDIMLKARENNMPLDNINRAIKKAAGELNTVNYEAVVYEGYGPNGMAVIVETLTDNKNRTAADLRRIFDRGGGALGVTGCAAVMFESKGFFLFDKNSPDKQGKAVDEVMMIAIECGADDFFEYDEYFELNCSVAKYFSVKDNLEKVGLNFVKSGLERVPLSFVKIEIDNYNKAIKMLESFEDNDDVQELYHNAELE